MDNRITSEEVADQFAKAIRLMLEWARQEMLVPAQSRLTNPIQDQEQGVDRTCLASKRLLKPKEVADILQVSRSPAYQMLRRGEVPTVRVDTAVRVRPSDLEEFIGKVKGM
jgi:excisionase family DNA binding protein